MNIRINAKIHAFSNINYISPIHIRYSFNADGSDFTEKYIEGQSYMGVAVSKDPPMNKEKYQWTRIAFREEINNLQNTVGDSTKGLVKQVNDNTSAISAIKNGASISSFKEVENTITSNLNKSKVYTDSLANGAVADNTFAISEIRNGEEINDFSSTENAINAVNQKVNEAVGNIDNYQKTIYIDAGGRGVDPKDGTTYDLTLVYNDIFSNVSKYRFMYLGYRSVSTPIYAHKGNNCIILSATLDVSIGIGVSGGITGIEATWLPRQSKITWSTVAVYGQPCLIEGTPINMVDGSTKAVEDVTSGDLVQSYDPVTQSIVPAVVIDSYITGYSRKFTTYSFTNGKYLTIFGSHGFYNKRVGYTEDIQNIKKNDVLVTLEGSETSLITSRELLVHGEKKRRYNIVTSNNMYFANGILLGQKPFAKLQYIIDRKIELPSEIRDVWQADIDDYDSYSSFLNDPAYHAEISEAYTKLSNAVNNIKINKQKLTDSDYWVQKFTEGLLTLGDWSEKKKKRAEWRQAVNDNEVLRDESKILVDQIIAKYRKGKTPKGIFESCCARDNAVFEECKEYFRK